MRRLTILALLTVFCASVWAEDPPEVARALETLRKSRSHDAEAVGYAGSKSDTYRAFEALRDNASPERLVELTDDKHAVVRCYAVQALAEKHPEVSLVPILVRHLEDKEEVETMRGCIGSQQLVADVMLEVGLLDIPEEDIEALLPRLLTPDCRLEVRDELLQTREFDPRWRPRLVALAKGGHDSALVALARFRNEADLPLIVAPLTAVSRSWVSRIPALEAAALFPDPSLMKALVALEGEANAENGRGKSYHPTYLYRAAAAQRSRGAAELLLRAASSGSHAGHRLGCHASYLSELMQEHIVELYRPVFHRLWTKHYELTTEVFQFLAAGDSERVADQAVSDFESRLNDLPDGCLEAMCVHLRTHRREKFVPLLVRGLETADVHHIRSLAYVAGEEQSEEFVAPLLARFASAKNPHIYLAAAKALVAYGRPELTAQLRKIVEETEHMRTSWAADKLTRVLGR